MGQAAGLTMLPPEVAHHDIIREGNRLSVLEIQLVMILIVRLGAVLSEVLW